MKTRTLLITIVLLTVVMVAIAGGSKKEISVDEAIEALSHTWVNPDYSPDFSSQKWVVYPDGVIKYYPKADTPLDTPALSARYTICFPSKQFGHISLFLKRQYNLIAA